MTGRRVLLAQRRQAAGFTQEALAERLGVDRSTVVRWEAAISNPQPWLRSQLSDALGVTTDELRDLLDGLDVEQLARLDDGATSRQEEDVDRRRLLESLAVLGIATAASPAAAALETIRSSVHNAFMATDTNVHFWQERVVEYGYSYLTDPPHQFVTDLAGDLVSIRLIVGRMKPSTSAYKDWCTVAGMLACAMAKSLSNLGHTREAGKWWRTAQSATDASGDLDAQMWVRSQNVIHGLYEKRSPHLLLRQTAEAIRLGSGHACHGLASSSTGRAQALVLAGKYDAAQRELVQAEQILGQLPDEVRSDPDSVHCFSEDRLRYTETWVYAYSGDTARTDVAAEQAKGLYPVTDFRTPLQIELLQAFSRTKSGDTTEGVRHAHSRLEALPLAQRTRMVGDLAQRVLEPLSEADLKRPDVISYRELLAQSPVKELTA